ncbi:hypothetical protein [Streptomyces sp. NPDC005322]|uniref:hypothetical protein n=1 Tax=Streptomyces sp. NPDC005322 TaxID=3157032 RepID=UPI0033BDC6CF
MAARGRRWTGPLAALGGALALALGLAALMLFDSPHSDARPSAVDRAEQRAHLSPGQNPPGRALLHPGGLPAGPVRPPLLAADAEVTDGLVAAWKGATTGPSVVS